MKTVIEQAIDYIDSGLVLAKDNHELLSHLKGIKYKLILLMPFEKVQICNAFIEGREAGQTNSDMKCTDYYKKEYPTGNNF